ncbi:MAG: ubiquinol-cytochrome c reductase iron-sulfur subunit [Actinomycetota bacterium]
MSPTMVAALVVVVSGGAWIVLVGYAGVAARRREAREAGGELRPGQAARELPWPAARLLGREDVSGVTRRQFLNRITVGGILVGLAQFGMASIDFLWPRLRGGFGATIDVGDAVALRSELQASREPKFIADGRFWLTLFEGNAQAAAKVPVYKDANTQATGICALYRKCPHLGCSVPWCAPSKWFECPCHGSKYSYNGEYRDGPAPRGLDRFRVEIRGGKCVVDTSTVLEGPPRGTRTSQPAPEGPHCVTIG